MRVSLCLDICCTFLPSAQDYEELSLMKVSNSTWYLNFVLMLIEQLPLSFLFQGPGERAPPPAAAAAAAPPSQPAQ